MDNWIAGVHAGELRQCEPEPGSGHAGRKYLLLRIAGQLDHAAEDADVDDALPWTFTAAAFTYSR